jgi:hypothetical protein
MGGLVLAAVVDKPWGEVAVKMFLRTCILCSLAIALGSISLSASADKVYYRWKDDRGNPVHSDRPPPAGIDYEVVSTGSNLKRDVSATEGAVPPEIEPRVGNEFEQTRTGLPTVEKNPEFCRRAQQNLESLDTAPRIRVRDDQGEYRYLSDEERAAERKKALDAIRVHCE